MIAGPVRNAKRPGPGQATPKKKKKVAAPATPSPLSPNTARRACHCGRGCSGRLIKTGDPAEKGRWLDRVMPAGAAGKKQRLALARNAEVMLWVGHWGRESLYLHGTSVRVRRVKPDGGGAEARALPMHGEPLSAADCEAAVAAAEALDTDSRRNDARRVQGRAALRCALGGRAGCLTPHPPVAPRPRQAGRLRR